MHPLQSSVNTTIGLFTKADIYNMIDIYLCNSIILDVHSFPSQLYILLSTKTLECSVHDPSQALRSKWMSVFCHFQQFCISFVAHYEVHISKIFVFLWTTSITMTDGQTNHFTPCACMRGNKALQCKILGA